MPEPLVLLPGLQSDHRSWVNQTRHFSPSRQVIVPQRHQHCDTIGATAERVLEQLPPRFHLAAWSMGGYIALQLLPQLVGRLGTETAKRIDTYATALFAGLTVDEVSDLDLSYTPPLGSPWDAVQNATQAWSRARLSLPVTT